MIKLKSYLELLRIKVPHGSFSLFVVLAILYPNITWFDSVLFFIGTFCGLLLVHVSDDIFGYKDGHDILNAQQKKDIKEPKPLVGGRINLKQSWFVFSILLSIIIYVGIELTIKHGFLFFILALFSLFYGYSYSGYPLKLSYRGLGETVIIICTGIMPMNIMYYINTYSFSLEVFILSIFLGMLFSSILMSSNRADIGGDVKTDRKTLTVRIVSRYGTDTLIFIQGVYILSAFVYLSIFIALGFLNGCLLLLFISFCIYGLQIIDMESGRFNRARKFSLYGYLSTVIIICIVSLVF